MLYIILVPFILAAYLIFGTKIGRRVFVTVILVMMGLFIVLCGGGVLWVFIAPEHADYFNYVLNNRNISDKERWLTLITDYFPWQRPDDWDPVNDTRTLSS